MTETSETMLKPILAVSVPRERNPKPPTFRGGFGVSGRMMAVLRRVLKSERKNAGRSSISIVYLPHCRRHNRTSFERLVRLALPIKRSSVKSSVKNVTNPRTIDHRLTEKVSETHIFRENENYTKRSIPPPPPSILGRSRRANSSKQRFSGYISVNAIIELAGLWSDLAFWAT